jgi:hypothetical protein
MSLISSEGRHNSNYTGPSVRIFFRNLFMFMNLNHAFYYRIQQSRHSNSSYHFYSILLVMVHPPRVAYYSTRDSNPICHSSVQRAGIIPNMVIRCNSIANNKWNRVVMCSFKNNFLFFCRITNTNILKLVLSFLFNFACYGFSISTPLESIK